MDLNDLQDLHSPPILGDNDDNLALGAGSDLMYLHVDMCGSPVLINLDNGFLHPVNELDLAHQEVPRPFTLCRITVAQDLAMLCIHSHHAQAWEDALLWSFQLGDTFISGKHDSSSLPPLFTPPHPPLRCGERRTLEHGCMWHQHSFRPCANSLYG